MVFGELAKLYDYLMQDVDYDAWAQYLGEFIGKGKSIVDCACGTGALTVRLAKMGNNVIGVDISREMLSAAAEKARELGLKIPFVLQDMRKLVVHRPVDVVVCGCDGVNYLTSREDAAKFFAAAFNALKPGGLLLFDISSHYKLSSILGMNVFAEDESECAYIWHNNYDEHNKLIEMNLSFFAREGELYRKFEERHIQRAHGEQELTRVLERAGFEDIRAYAAFSDSPVSETTERIQFVARRP